MMLLAQQRHRLAALELRQIARQSADGLPERKRAPRPISVPKRHFSGLARRRRNQYSIMRDLFGAPGARAEQEHFALAQLEHHFFVELTDAAPAFGAFFTRKE